MWYVITIIILILLIYLKLKSNSNFFLQSIDILLYKRNDIEHLLKIKGRDESEIKHYLDAYDFFCEFNTDYDGATFVKDLDDIPDLDLDAMVHDYDCILGANRNYEKWYHAIWIYYENMRKNGKGNQILRALGLIIIGLLFVPYCIIKNSLK